YVIGGTFGLVVPGGQDELHPFILAGYPGETAILDGTGLNTVVVIDHAYIIVEHLTIRNGSKYNVRVGGQYTILVQNTPQGSSDSIKSVTGADHGFIYNNEISEFSDTAIDQFGAAYWLIKSNNIHDCLSAFSGIMLKGGSQYTAIIDNDIHDFVQLA